MSLPSRNDWDDLVRGKTPYWGAAPQSPVLFPGSFNPIHDGHRQMAIIAARRLGRTVHLEISLSNVDKPDVSFESLCGRLDKARQLAPTILTRSPRFVDKAKLFSGATFVIGADTALRLDDPRYYDDELSRRDEALESIGQFGCRFFVFGRKIGAKYCDATALPLSCKLAALCDRVPETEFRVDVSSSDIRRSS